MVKVGEICKIKVSFYATENKISIFNVFIFGGYVFNAFNVVTHSLGVSCKEHYVIFITLKSLFESIISFNFFTNENINLAKSINMYN